MILICISVVVDYAIVILFPKQILHIIDLSAKHTILKSLTLFYFKCMSYIVPQNVLKSCIVQ